MIRFSAVKAARMMNGMKNSQAQECSSMAGRTMVSQELSVAIWKRLNREDPRFPKYSGMVSRKNVVAMTAET